MEAAKRTASIFIGVGSRSDGFFNAYEYEEKELNVFQPDTPFPGYEPTPPEHPVIADCVYVDKHTQPSTDPCTADLLQGQYGSMNYSSFAHGFVPVVQTGYVAVSSLFFLFCLCCLCVMCVLGGV